MDPLPCGHPPPLYATTDGRQLPIALPPMNPSYGHLPASVWCTHHGWVTVDDTTYTNLGPHA